MDCFDKSLSYLVDCRLSDTSDTTVTTDSIRSQILQLNATKDQLTSQKAFDHRRHDLLIRLAQRVDTEFGPRPVNTYLSPALIRCVSRGRTSQENRQSTTQSMTECQSSLYSLTSDQLLTALDITPKMDDNTDCQVVDVVVKKPEDIHSKTKSSKEVKRFKSNYSKSNYPNEPKKNVFDTLGSFANGFPQQPVNDKSSAISSMNGHSSKSPISPTRVSGIFRSNPPQRSISVNGAEDEVQEIGTKRSFLSGYEKKIVEEVKNGSMTLKAARRELNNFRPPFKENSSRAKKDEEITDPHLKNIDKHLIEIIENEIITHLEPIKREDVAGLEFAKNKIYEIAILPLKKPHLFTGLRKPPKGILLFGPPGTGKTFLGRWIASETKSTFFEITASTLNSKWIGEGEKTIRAMFAVARARQPSVIFIDEIDSLLKSRCDTEHESSRRMKTEFFTQFEGVSTATDEKLLIIGATNRPQDLDDAARRRLTARLYIGLPDESSRTQLIKNCLRPENNVSHELTEQQIQCIGRQTDGYSCADMNLLCKEAAMEGIREMQLSEDNEDNEESEEQVRRITYQDFEKQLQFVKPSVCGDNIHQFEDWDRQFGTNRR